MSYFPRRLICSAIEELRDCSKKLSWWNVKKYKAMIELITEEIQILANRMESFIDEKHDVEKMHEERKDLKREIKELSRKKKDLQIELDGKEKIEVVKHDKSVKDYLGFDEYE